MILGSILGIWRYNAFRVLIRDIDIEILFCVDYSTTCNMRPVGLLLRQTGINKHNKTTSITTCTYIKQYYKR